MEGSMIPASDITASALHAERSRLEVIATNLANANNTKDVNGETYRRKQVVFEQVLRNEFGKPVGGRGVKIAKIQEDQRPLPMIHMPGHPHADNNGMVKMPNVNVVEEMVDMMTASRSYEANLQVLKASKDMANSTLRIAAG